MSLYVIPKTTGFYDTSIHGEMPDGAIEISSEAHAALLDAQSSGKLIDWSGDVPVSVDVAPQSNEELAAMARSKRDALLTSCDWTQVSDAPVDQLAWREYRQALRDVPEQSGFPLDIDWPVAPQ